MQRPALERLRDLAYSGVIDRLYIHSPDRLARNYTYQVMLLEEFQKHQVEVVFLNDVVGSTSPEGNLLLQVQGMMAEFERAKIRERTRRGRRFAARQGAELFQAMAERFEDNRRRYREQKKGAEYLLSGLLVCAQCNSA